MGGESPEKHTAGAEALVDFAALEARLKSCPDTKLPKISAGSSFSAACEARTLQTAPLTELPAAERAAEKG